jgi:hypothetical protein
VAFIRIRNQTIVNTMLANEETDRLVYACILNVDHDNKRTIFKEILIFYLPGAKLPLFIKRRVQFSTLVATTTVVI